MRSARKAPRGDTMLGGIWVDKGCEADFVLGVPGHSASSGTAAAKTQTISCASYFAAGSSWYRQEARSSRGFVGERLREDRGEAGSESVGATVPASVARTARGVQCAKLIQDDGGRNSAKVRIVGRECACILR